MAGLMYLDTPIGRLRLEDNGNAISRIHFEADEDFRLKENPAELCYIARHQLKEYFEAKRISFDFPFQQTGTDFQQRVWNQLLDIPCGKTISYLQLARQLNDEKCIRAAASANGKNNLAIIIPCHRVIGSAGKLVGYAGGLWRKKWLIEHEQSMTGRFMQGSLF